MISTEARRLYALLGKRPPENAATKAGDLWQIKTRGNDLSYVLLIMGHKKNGRRIDAGHTYVYMYHWGRPCLHAKPCDLRDFDANAQCAERSLMRFAERGELVGYLGNIFEMLPLSELLA